MPSVIFLTWGPRSWALGGSAKTNSKAPTKVVKRALMIPPFPSRMPTGSRGSRRGSVHFAPGPATHSREQPDQSVRGNRWIDQIIPEVARFVRAAEIGEHRGDDDEHDGIEPRAPRSQGHQQQSRDELDRSIAERVRIERREAQRERVQENSRARHQPHECAQIALSDQSASGELRDARCTGQSKRAYARIPGDAPNVSRERELAEGHEERDPRGEHNGDARTDRKPSQAKRGRDERKTEEHAAEKTERDVRGHQPLPSSQARLKCTCLMRERPQV